MSVTSSDYGPQPSVFDFHDFMASMQELYFQIKKQSQLQTKSCWMVNSKFSYAFQNKYAQLSTGFDSVISKGQVKFQDHKGCLEDQQQRISEIITSLNPTQQLNFMNMISRMLVRSQSIYQNWMKQQVVTIKQELERVIWKNCQFQVQIGQSYEQYEQVKQRLDQELNYRYELQRHLVATQEQLMALKQLNMDLTCQNKSLLDSKYELVVQIAEDKVTQGNLAKSVTRQEDSLLSQKAKNEQLMTQIRRLSQRVKMVQRQLQQSRSEQQNLLQQIKHLQQIVDNQSYQLDFHKGREARQSKSITHQSYQKLNNYGGLLENYNRTSERGSLRNLILTNQKSMGRLAIFQNREKCHGLQEKVSQSDLSLQSFEFVPSATLRKQQSKEQSFYFNQFNQITFRPEKDNVIQHEQFMRINLQNQEDYQQKQQLKDGQVYNQLVQNFPERRHARQRSLSITQGNCNSVSKKLLYDQVREEGIILPLPQDMKQQQKQESLQSSVESKNKVKSVIHPSRIYVPIREPKLKSQFKTSHHLMKKESTLDNQSQKNSVNKVLIKKNIKIQRQVDELTQELDQAQSKIEQYEGLIHQLRDHIDFYKKQLSKASQMKIRYKSEIQSFMAERQAVQMLKQTLERSEKCKYQAQIRQRGEEIVILRNEVLLLNQDLHLQKTNFQQRIAKVKQLCKRYVKEKHQAYSRSIIDDYEQQIYDLKQLIYKQKLANQIKKIVKQSSSTQTTPKQLLIVPSPSEYTHCPRGKAQSETQVIAINQNLKIEKVLNSITHHPKVRLDRQSHFDCSVVNDFKIHPYISIYIPGSILQVSPYYFKKQLLNTPSNANTLDTGKEGTQSCRLSKQCQSRQRSQESSRSQVFEQAQGQSLEDSFSTVSLIKGRQSLRRNSQPQAFFSCIEFSENSIRQDSQNVQSCDVFENGKLLSSQPDVLVSVKNSSELQSIGQSASQLTSLQSHQPIKSMISVPQFQQVSQNHQEQGLSVAQKAIYTDLQVTVQHVRARLSSRYGSRYGRNPSDCLFKVFLPEENRNTEEEKFYARLFQKNLTAYFKRHTTFKFSSEVFQSEYIPHPQKMYLIHTSSSSESKSQRFLLYKKLLLNLETQQKLQMPRSAMFKFIEDSSKLVLGNFEILVNQERQLKVTRRNKRCYYVGELADGTWAISKIQEILITGTFRKK